MLLSDLGCCCWLARRFGGASVVHTESAPGWLFMSGWFAAVDVVAMAAERFDASLLLPPMACHQIPDQPEVCFEFWAELWADCGLDVGEVSWCGLAIDSGVNCGFDGMPGFSVPGC